MHKGFYTKPLLSLAAGFVFVALSTVGFAQDAPTAEVTPSAEIPTTLEPLPEMVRIQGLRPVYQQVNRCSAAALTIQLSHFEWEGNYDQVIAGLNPHADDVAVRLDEMVSYVQSQGLEAIERVGGTLDLLRHLVAADFPVLIENSYFDGAGGLNDWMSHNRIVMGYDDNLREIYTFDPLLGNGPDNTGRPIPYDDIDNRWRPFNRDYLVIYEAEREAELQAILGEFWDPVAAHEFALTQSQAEIDNGTADGYTYFNLGSSLLATANYVDAATAFDQALSRELPWRMLWYQYGPFEAYLALGRNEDVLRLANSVIVTTPGVEEAYFFVGAAYEQMGELRGALSHYQQSLTRNRNFAAAANGVARIEALMVTPTPGA